MENCLFRYSRLCSSTHYKQRKAVFMYIGNWGGKNEKKINIKHIFIDLQ